MQRSTHMFVLAQNVCVHVVSIEQLYNQPNMTNTFELLLDNNLLLHVNIPIYYQ